MSNIPLIVLLSEDHAGCKEQFAIDFGVAINVPPDSLDYHRNTLSSELRKSRCLIWKIQNRTMAHVFTTTETPLREGN